LGPPIGGVGIAEIVGAATPARAPHPLPAEPSAASGACAPQVAAALLTSTSTSDVDGDPSGTPAWIWVVLAVLAVLVVVAGATFLGRTRRVAP
jgi:hypothetical protein